MISCIDTNVISALLRNEQGAEFWAARLLHAGVEGSALIHASVYAELLAAPDMTREHLARFLRAARIVVDWDTPPAVWELAGVSYAAYSQRRQRSGGGLPRRLLVDFLIGAHASQLTATLLTLDPQHYRLGFPALRLDAGP